MPIFTPKSAPEAKTRTATQRTTPQQASPFATNGALTRMGTYHYARSPLQRRALHASATDVTEATHSNAPQVGGAHSSGLPVNLRSGIQALSGLSLDYVKVHYNSSKPAQVDALAYAQGNDIHLAPGQEKDLPHEAWHVVQQAQGRAKPTTQLKNGMSVNDDAGLERDADVMGSRALANATQPMTASDAGGRLYANTTPNPTLQRRRIVHHGNGYVAGIDTENLTMEELEGWLERGSLSPSNQLELMRAIDAGEVKGGYPGAYEYAERHLDFLRKALPNFGEINEFSWLRRITGGGAGSLTGKRDAGGIKTDMSEEEYVATEELTKGFYGTADLLNKATPREEFLTLFRGFTVPAIEGEHADEQLAKIIGAYSDVLPSSASWQREQAVGMSDPRVGESAVLIYMNISPDHPIVIMSYPSNETPKDKPAPLDIGQAEVLVAASNYEDVNVFRIEQLKSGRLRYHVEVTLVARDPAQILEGIETARAAADSKRKPKGESIDIAVSDLAKVFGTEVGKTLVESPKENSTYQDLKGNSWELQIADEFFGYTFHKVVA